MRLRCYLCDMVIVSAYINDKAQKCMCGWPSINVNHQQLVKEILWEKQMSEHDSTGMILISPQEVKNLKFACDQLTRRLSDRSSNEWADELGDGLYNKINDLIMRVHDILRKDHA